MLTPEQLAHFNAFGFVVRKSLFSPDEMETISRVFDEVMDEDRKGQPFSGEKRHGVFACVELRPELRSLIDDDRIHGPMEQLLGPDYMWWGSDGNLYVGDTAWHSDAAEPEMGHARIKIEFYLDAVTKDTGCLRVIPGSHRLPLHADLEPLRMRRVIQTIEEGRNTNEALKPFIEMGLDLDKDAFGVESPELPGVALESEPGDVVFFEQHLYHGSWGGMTGRRMFTLNYFANPTTDQQLSQLGEMHASSLGSMQAISFTKRSTLHEDELINSDRPRIQRMMARNLELGFR